MVDVGKGIERPDIEMVDDDIGHGKQFPPLRLSLLLQSEMSITIFNRSM